MIHNESDINGKLMHIFWDVAHVLRNTSGGRGSQKRILTVLLRSDSISQAELTEYLGIQSASASEALTKMEAAGLISRTESETDRRTIMLSLTPLGREKAAVALEERERKKKDMFSVLSQEEKEILLSILEKLVTDWHKRYGEPGKRGRKTE